LRAHFHNTRNTGTANALAAVAAGVTVLDSSLGGIGGCPFTPRATDNVATEDVVSALHLSRDRTGLALKEPPQARARVENTVVAVVPAGGRRLSPGFDACLEAGHHSFRRRVGHRVIGPCACRRSRPCFVLLCRSTRCSAATIQDDRSCTSCFSGKTEINISFSFTVLHTT